MTRVVKVLIQRANQNWKQMHVGLVEEIHDVMSGSWIWLVEMTVIMDHAVSFSLRIFSSYKKVIKFTVNTSLFSMPTFLLFLKLHALHCVTLLIESEWKYSSITFIQQTVAITARYKTVNSNSLILRRDSVCTCYVGLHWSLGSRGEE